MIDIKRIKENPDAIKAGMKAEEVDCDATIDRILELDKEQEEANERREKEAEQR